MLETAGGSAGACVYPCISGVVVRGLADHLPDGDIGCRGTYISGLPHSLKHSSGQTCGPISSVRADVFAHVFCRIRRVLIESPQALARAVL